jgi:hypothetical protein
MFRRFVLVSLAGLFVIVGSAPAGAANACAAKKLKAAAKDVTCQTTLDAKEVAKNVPKDPAKVTKCQATFTAAFAKNEAKGGCLTTGDAATAGASVDAFVLALDQALSLGAPNACQGAKIKAAAKKASCKTKLEAKQAAKGGPIDPAKWVKCETNFELAFMKLEAKGGCATTGDVAAVETTVDAFVAALASALDPGLPSVSLSPVLHIDASDAGNLTLDGSDVDGATDLSGSGNHMVLSAAFTAKPTFASGGIVPSLGAIRFENGKSLQTINQAPFDGTTFTAFVVFRVAAFDTWNFIVGDDSYQWGSGWGLEAAGDLLGAFANGGPVERVTAAVDTTYVAAVVNDGLSIVSYANGVLQTTDATVAGYDPLPYAFSVGNSDFTVDSWGLDGWVGEVVFYPGALSASEREVIEDFLAAKWN